MNMRKRGERLDGSGEHDNMPRCDVNRRYDLLEEQDEHGVDMNEWETLS